jgi:hypothetical protein
MAGTSVRRPIPAVVFILLLSLLSAIVWYRVLNRSSATSSKATTTTTTHACATKPRTGAASSSKPPAVIWPRPSAVRVIVLNGTQRAGLAKSVATQLKSRGFVVGTIGNDTVDTVTATQVRYGPRLATAAKLLQLYLPGSKLVANRSTAATVTVSLGSSYTRLSTNTAVARAKLTNPTTATTC